MKTRDHGMLLSSLQNAGDFSEVYEEQTVSSLLENDTGRIERCLEVSEGGIALRTLRPDGILFTSSNYLSEGDLLARHSATLPAGQGVFLHERRFAGEFRFSGTAADRIPLTHECYERLRDALPGLLNAKITLARYDKQFVVSNDRGVCTAADTRGERFSIHITVAVSGEKITVYESAGYSFGVVGETEIFGLVDACISRAKILAAARPGPAGVFPCVLSAEAGGTLIHEAVGHGLEADLVDKGISIYGGRMGEKVASELITVVDDATVPQGWGSFLCDDEGTPAQKTVLIEKGVLKNYLYDVYYARRRGAVSTGNGRRQSYQHKPYPRMTNTRIEPGADDPVGLLRSIDRGVFVKKMGGGQVNTLTGDFIFEILDGYMVEKGELLYPLKNCSLIGNGPRVLDEIDGVGADFGTSLGTCGKEGQGVPVGDGQPTVRIPRITVGGTAV